MNWGQRIKKRREDLKFTQKELANKIGVADSYLTQIEKDGKVPSAKIAIKLAKALGENPKEYVLWSVKAKIEKEALPYLDL